MEKETDNENISGEELKARAESAAQAPLSAVSIDDAYWNRYTRLSRDVMIPYQWRALNDEVDGAPPSHCLENFKIAAGDKVGERRGTVFQDSDAFKWLETVAYVLAVSRDSALEEKADGVIDLICRAQESDGYIDTYFQLSRPELKWRNLNEGHELYCAGHLMEAAAAYFEATGKDRLLRCAEKFADLIAERFGDGGGRSRGCPGHPEVELALVKMFRATGCRKYLDAAKYFIDTRGTPPNCFEEEMKKPGFGHVFEGSSVFIPEYNQSHLPVRRQTKAEGHAVRAVYLYCAMADVAGLTGDVGLLESCKALWRDMTERRMYITGGIGSSGVLERFTTDWDLPNDSAYCETCASVALALFALRMARLTRKASYIDVCERALYNTVRAGVSMAGDRYFYVNPLEVWPASCMENTSRSHVKAVRQKWFDVACCPTNVARTLASLGQYVYTIDGDSLYVNLFVQNEADVVVNGGKVSVKIETDYPRTGRAKIFIDGAGGTFALRVRKPAFADDFAMSVNGVAVGAESFDGWVGARREWGRDTVDVSFAMKARLVFANPLVRADCGKAAILRGPEVYCLEECDNGANLAAISIESGCRITEEWRADIMGGTMLLRLDGRRLAVPPDGTGAVMDAEPSQENVSLIAAPYGSWGNRKEGEMIVWLRVR